MKKSLNNFFDEAKANELEVLLGKNAAPDISKGTLASIKKKVYTKAGITKSKKKPLVLPWRSYLSVAVCLLLVVGSVLGTLTISNLLGRVPPSQTLPQEIDSASVAGTNPLSPPSSTPNTSPVTRPPFSISELNNGVLKDVSVKSMNIPTNIKELGTTEIKEENNSKNVKATTVMYTLDGEVVNWVSENDFIYVITKGNNRLVIIDTLSMSAVYNTPLAGNPAEMNIAGDRIYISFPDLCRIDVFSKVDCEKKGAIYFNYEVSSFCLDGDYIFYSEHDQHCRVFKKNLVTGVESVVPNGQHNFFYKPKIYLNKEDRILYIGESGSSGSGIYYYDADTLTLKSKFKKNDYGITNNTREIFHVGDSVFWGNYRLSDTNAQELIGRYGTASYGSLVYASTELVATREGIFLTDTYECVVNYFDAQFDFEYVLVSQSYNVFFRERYSSVIVGVNFELLETSEPI